MFDKNFVWGCASSAYQIEGGWNEGGRGLSVWDTFCHTPGKIYENQTGDVACDFFHRYEEDIAIMHELGIQAYRFSLSWPRILPEGTGKVNEEGIAFYNRVIDCLLRHGIEPYITLYHWDYPQALQDRGGWVNPESVNWFAEYAAVVSNAFSDRVTKFITLNEPQCFTGLAPRRARPRHQAAHQRPVPDGPQCAQSPRRGGHRPPGPRKAAHRSGLRPHLRHGVPQNRDPGRH